MQNKMTMAEALDYQAEHLAKWEAILKPEAFVKLKELVTETNSTVEDPYDVCRGVGIDEIVANYLK